MYDLYETLKVTPNDAKRKELGQEIVRMHAENLWTIGIVMFPQPVIEDLNLRNVPDVAINDWRVIDPSYTLPEHWWIDE